MKRRITIWFRCQFVDSTNLKAYFNLSIAVSDVNEPPYFPMKQIIINFLFLKVVHQSHSWTDCCSRL